MVTYCMQGEMIRLYNLLLLGFLCLGSPLLILIFLFSEKRRRTIPYRLGWGGIQPSQTVRHKEKKPTGPIWIHALSVGEVLSAVPLVGEIARAFPEFPLFFSASTQTGFEIAQQELSKNTDGLLYFPFDFGFAIRRRLRQLSPRLIIIVETDVWPNFMHIAQKKQISALLVNARLSEKTLKGYRKLRILTRPMLSSFDLICTQTRLDLERFRSLGVKEEHLAVTGNIKFHQSNGPVNGAETAVSRPSLGLEKDRPVLLAGSTHPGEETIILKSFSRIKKEFPDLLLILAPRDPKRAARICQVSTENGFSSATVQAQRQHPSHKRDVLVVDRMGQLRNLYALGDVAFIGGSLTADGGHNPLEAAAHARPILFGPDMRDFAEIAGMLLESGGAEVTADGDALAAACLRLLTRPDERASRGEKTRRVFQDNQGAVKETIAHIRSLLT